MASEGRKPDFSISARNKTGGERIKIASGWENQWGSYNIRFQPGTKIKLPDGTVLNCDEFWFDGKVWVSRGETQSAKPADQKTGGDKEWGEEDPF